MKGNKPMAVKTIALEFTEEQIEKFDTIKEVVGGNRNRALAAMLVISFDNLFNREGMKQVYSVMSEIDAAKMESNAFDFFTGTSKKPTTKNTTQKGKDTDPKTE